MEKYPNKRAYARPELRKFLMEEGLYKQFKKNVKEDTEFRFFGSINEAFIWGDTEEGLNFWEKVHDKWVQYARSI